MTRVGSQRHRIKGGVSKTFFFFGNGDLLMFSQWRCTSRLKQNKPLTSQAVDRNVITVRYESRFVACTLCFAVLEIDVTGDSVVL